MAARWASEGVAAAMVAVSVKSRAEGFKSLGCHLRLHAVPLAITPITASTNTPLRTAASEERHAEQALVAGLIDPTPGRNVSFDSDYRGLSSLNKRLVDAEGMK